MFCSTFGFSNGQRGCLTTWRSIVHIDFGWMLAKVRVTAMISLWVYIVFILILFCVGHAYEHRSIRAF
jgi:hypothetical protein